MACAVAACGGGGGGGGSSVLPATAPTQTPATTPTIGPPAASASGTISISIPRYVSVSHAGRTPSFVSPGTQSVSIQLVQANGAAPATPYSTQSDLTSSSPNCTSSSSGLTCAVPVTLPVGSDVLTLKTYSGTALGGSLIGTATTPVTILQNARNTLGVSVSGVVASLAAFAANGGSFASGAAATTHLYIVALDSTGNIILGSGTSNPTPTYDNPLSITMSPSTSAFTTVATGTTTAKSTITGPGDLVDIAYSGSATGTNATIVVSGVTGSGGTPTASLAVSAGTAPLAAAITSGATGPSIALTAVGGSTTVTLSGGKPPYTATSSNSSIATVSGTFPTFTVLATGYGSGMVTFTDANSNVVTRNVSVQATTPVSIAVGAQNQVSTATSSLVNMNNNGSAYQSLTFSGGDGSNYAVTVAGSSGGTGTSSSVIAVNGTGNPYTVTPKGLGTDFVVIKSGGQTATIQFNVGTSGAGSVSVFPGVAGQAVFIGGTLYLTPLGQVSLYPSGGSGIYATTLTTSGSCTYLSLGSLISGSYGISATSAGSGCSVAVKDLAGNSSTSFPIVAVSSLIASTSVTIPTVGGNATLFVSGGTGSYTCTSLQPTIATVPSSCNSSSIVAGVAAGSTSIYVKDNTTNFQVTVPVTVGANSAFSATVTPGTFSATSGSNIYVFSGIAGGKFGITLSGGSGKYNAPTTTCSPSYGTLTTTLPTMTFASASPGTCAISVTDTAGASASFNVTVETPVSASAPAAVFSNTSAGAQTFTISGGVGPYTFSSSNSSVVSVNSSGSSLTVTPGTFSNNSATITITDANGVAMLLPVIVGGATSGSLGITVNPNPNQIVRPTNITNDPNASAGWTHIAALAGSTVSFSVNGGGPLFNSGLTTYTVTTNCSPTPAAFLGTGPTFSSTLGGVPLSCDRTSGPASYYLITDNAGGSALLYMDTYNALAPIVGSYSTPTGTASSIADGHGYAPQNQLELLGAGSVGVFQIPTTNLSSGGSCSKVNVSFAGTGPVTIASTSGGPFGTTTVPMSQNGAYCEVYVQSVTAGYTRLTFTDINLNATDQSVTQTQIGVGVTTVTIPVLNRGRAK